MLEHYKLREWDDKLKKICDGIDSLLEDRYGKLYRLRPNRPERGSTYNPEMDGLFNVQAVFTPGYRSEKGRGYLVEIELSTLEAVNPDIKKKILGEVMELMKEGLEREFPGRNLEVGLDGRHLKIWGDLSLGNV